MDFRKYFDLDPHFIHLNNAGCAPLTTRALTATTEALKAHAHQGFHWRPQFTQTLIDTKAQIAKFLGTKPDYVAMTPNCATAISTVARGLEFHKDDEILTWDQEYPTNAYIWHRVAKESGAKVVVLDSEKNFEVNLDKMLSKINKHTRVVAISWVQSVAGAITPLKPILEACNKVGAWLVVDAFQGLGCLPFKMSDYPGIVITTGTQKWLCGPLGHGILAFSDDRYLELKPMFEGAMTFGGVDKTDLSKDYIPSAARFEPGTPLILTVIGAAASISCIEEFGLENIREKNITLRDHLLKGLQNQDAKIFGTLNSQNSGPHVTFIPRKNFETCKKNLDHNRISYVTKLNGFRLSPHAFNTIQELDQALECLKGD